MLLVAPEGTLSVEDAEGNVYTAADGIIDVPDGLAAELRSQGFSAGALEFLRGKEGPVGPQGPAGDDSTVVGPQGIPGVNGKDSSVAGPRGPEGPTGPEGPIGPMPKHQWRGTELRFEQAPGRWGDYVDLQGPSGRSGTTFVGGGGGSTTPQFFGTGYARILDGTPQLASNDVTGIENATFASEFDAGNSGSSVTIDWSRGNFQKLTLTANTTINVGTFPGVGRYQLRLKQDGNSHRTVAWAGTHYASNRWINRSSAPLMNSSNLGEMIITLVWDGSTLTQSFGYIGSAPA